MKLTELEPRWVRWEDRIEPSMHVAPGFDTSTEAGSAAWNAAGRPTVEVIGPRTYLVTVATLADAQGIAFRCPKCGDGHWVQIAFRERGVLDHQGTRGSDGGPTRWQVVSGASFDDLTLSPSIDETASLPTGWHGYITNGQIS